MTIVRARSFVLAGSVLAVLVLSGSAGHAQNPSSGPQTETPRPQPQVEAPRPAAINRNGVLILIRSTLLALDDANKTGNYSVLRDLGAPAFRLANSDARLSETFASERRNNLDLSGVAVVDPQLSLLPQIESNGMMRMAGFFPSVPTQVNFELLYAAVNRQWRLMGLAVSLGQTAPVAPAPPAAATASPAPPQPGPEPKAKAKLKPKPKPKPPEARLSPHEAPPVQR